MRHSKLVTSFLPEIHSMDKRNRDILDNEIIMTTLSNNVSYCEIEVHQKTLRIVVIDGTPVDFRLFSILCLFNITGGVYSYKHKIDNDLLAFWKLINFKYTKDVSNNSGYDIANMTFEYNSFDTSITSIVLSKLNICSGGSRSDTIMADYTPLMKSISQYVKKYGN